MLDTRNQILSLVSRFAQERGEEKFIPGETKIRFSTRFYDQSELLNLVSASLDFTLTSGSWTAEFERRMKEFFGSRKFLFVNSGSSANLLMIAALAERLSNRGEIITPAVTFPTTLAPIVQYGFTPVFVDVGDCTYNIDVDLVEEAITEKTVAIFIPHTLGFPADVARLASICQAKNLILLEDCCDALGASAPEGQVGSFGAMASLSFYPAHHITTGEGGGVVINDRTFARHAESLRGWGRDCWCEPGESDTCKNRFGWQMGDLPCGYDHKYTYSHIGFNLKATDLQAAIGVAQTTKIDDVVLKRRDNFFRLREATADNPKIHHVSYHEYAFISPFGFPIMLAEGVDRRKVIAHLESAGIETRHVFGGNILRQPGFKNIAHRVHGNLDQSDRVMNQAFWIGVGPHLTHEMLDYMSETLREATR